MRDVIAEEALDRFQVRGFECVVRAGFCALNGYVRCLPVLAELPLDALEEVGDPPGGFTYEDSHFGWVGFDTAHAFDFWDPADLAGLVSDEGMLVAQHFARWLTGAGEMGRRWTRDAVRAETALVAWRLADLAVRVASSRMLTATRHGHGL